MRKLAPVLLFATACSSPTDLIEEGRPGIIVGLLDDSIRIEAPDTVIRGQPFQMAVMTFGDGCTTRVRTSVMFDDQGAVITPYDRRPEAEVCTAELRSLRHEATLTFEHTGRNRVLVRGRHSDGSAAADARFVFVK